MAQLQNTFSWSLTRQQMFDECRRQYYLNYYGSWGGWDDRADPAARLAYRLKQIVNLEMWIGDLLHRLIHGQLDRVRRGFRPMPNPLREQARGLLNTEWKQSVDKRWRESPKHNRNLFEHYYGVEISDERRTAMRDRLFACLDHFCQLPLLDTLLAAEPRQWRAVEELDTFAVDQVPVFVKIDCAIELDGRTTIIDWKSGRASERDADQTACYGLYAMQKWTLPFEKIRALLVYLLSNESSESPVTAERSLAVQEKIVSGIAAMRACLADPAGNVAREEVFPMTDQKRRCLRCNFHEICYGAGPIG